MKERPILFNDEMVRALLDGRKTQTRRLLKPQPAGARAVALPDGWGFDFVTDRKGQPQRYHETIRCPYGQPGDRLWVRETWAAFDADGRHPGKPHDLQDGPWPRVGYAADGVLPPGTTRPSIHMPRWACRLLLEVTAVRVERLRDISQEDARAEGGPTKGHSGGPISAREGFKHLWKNINGADSWDSNPWVWVVEFKRIDPQQVAA